MNLTILTNGTFEEQKALYNNDEKQVLITGDYYHDKIDEYITGFIAGLQYCGNKVILNEKTIYSNNELFIVCNFENDEYDENIEDDYDEEDISDIDDINDFQETEPIISSENYKPTTNYKFRIDHYDSRYCGKLYTQDILEALDQTRNCEGDLYDGDKFIYSCLGFDWEYNLELISEYGVKYEQGKGFYVE
jgi:hypothetical protein